ncbi:hypothetical protein PVAP13_8NG110404 [Panicum virgatum]|uniref:Retrovirus-related Pol polyprotein from transposon TNT 1-94-like beta-barrel domain-containing protein n=1 Tax=Panicum virgatum TaxID=38727 RepID=A0A8T0PCJ2_PANVG|nr:hypothetical protein PVAP13_8NG110404 [Panicum virgatum]
MASSTSPAEASGGTGGNSSSGIAGEADWFMASGATNHMTGDRTLISNLVPVSNQVVQAGNGAGMLVCGRGSVNTETVVLPDVWYVPGLTMNLVSVGQLTEDPDLSVSMGGGMCRISKTSDGSVLGRAPLRSRKYVVDFLKVQRN